jgi:hypothetical protein
LGELGTLEALDTAPSFADAEPLGTPPSFANADPLGMFGVLAG